jgi:hypothetical protein
MTKAAMRAEIKRLKQENKILKIQAIGKVPGCSKCKVPLDDNYDCTNPDCEIHYMGDKLGQK